MFSQKTYHLSYIILALFLLNCDGDDSNSGSNNQGDINFVKTFGGTKNDSGQSVVNTNDGGYAVLGYTQSMDGDITDKQNESFDYLVLKFNAQDDLQWSKTYGGTEDDRGESIIQMLF